MIDAAPTAANAEYYARIVRDKAIQRKLIDVGTGIEPDAVGHVTSGEQQGDDREPCDHDARHGGDADL